MLTIKTFNGFALDFDNPNAMEPGRPMYNVVVTGTSAIVPMSSGGRFELYGTDFTYDPIAMHATGNVNKILYFRNDVLMAEASNANIDAATVFNLAKMPYGGGQVLNYLLQGSDRFELGSGNDNVWNSAGADYIDGGEGYDSVRYFDSKSGYTLTRDSDGIVYVKNAAGVVDTLKNVERIDFGDGSITTDQIAQPANPGGLLLGGDGSTIEGKGALDTVTYSAAKANYSFARNGDSITVSDSNGVANVLVNVERLSFSDGVLALDIDGNAGMAYRLYQAALERTPDNDGLKYWIGRLDSGDTNLAALADSFINSPEFKSTYGDERSVSNSKFVELLYTHTLGRNYDQDGYNYWVSKLNGNETNRRDLLAFFSESNENKAQVYDAISDGIWLT